MADPRARDDRVGAVQGLPRVPAGTAVEIRSRFDGSWTAGFEVDEVIDDASPQYRVRRLSDGALLPRLFAAGEVAERSP